MRTPLATASLLAALLAAGSAVALDWSSAYGPLAQSQAGQRAARTPDVIFVPTPQEVVEDMLRLVDVKKGDPDRIAEAQENAKKAGVTKLVDFRLEDLFKSDFREATVVTLYLLPELNVRLRPRLLAELKPGTRIVSHQFDMGDWRPDKKLESNGRVVYFWTIPDPKRRR